MAMDRITEEIAHFAGLFDLVAEAAKLRVDYEAFRVGSEAPVLTPVREMPFSGVADPMPKAVQVGLSDRIRSEETSPLPLPDGMATTVAPEDAPVLASSRDEIGLPLPVPPGGGEGGAIGGMTDIPPNSIVMAVRQINHLSDDDVLIFDGSAQFIDPLRLSDLDEMVQSLSPVAPWDWHQSSGDAAGAAKQLVTALEALRAPEIESADITLVRGQEAQGTFADGVAVDEAPALKGLMPAFLKPQDDAEAEAEASDGVTDDAPGPFAVEPGHHIVSGGNRAINEAVLKSVWVDAPVIAVAEDVVRLDVISQVTLRIESAILPAQACAGASNAINVARLEQTLAGPPGEDAMQTAGGTDDGLPLIWNVTRVEGDLMLVNWVQQHIFVSDNDRIEVKFTGAATFIGTGENLVFNESLILNLGFHYDLILIGGSLVTLNQISQVNVLLDQDVVTGCVPGGAGLQAGDNLQANTAAILTIGKDCLSDLSDDFDAALGELAEGAETIPATVAQDALFSGIEALNVLYISGDLIQANVINQSNYLGDSDQIHFIKDMISTADGAEVTVTTGSNAQINAASVIVLGLDSTVMAGGAAYTDAVIYQAELIEDDAPPTGVQISGLVSEAVVFLAEDMIDSPAGQDDCPGFHVADGSGAADVMQTMLT